MPGIADQLKIEGTEYDRRRKLSEEDKKEIMKLTRRGETQTRIARKFMISRRAVSFITDPKALEENLKRREERGGWRQYHDEEEHTERINELREYKMDLLMHHKIERR